VDIRRFTCTPAAEGVYFTLPVPPEHPKAPAMIVSAKGAGNMGPSWEKTNRNRVKLYNELGIRPESVRVLRQEHTKRVFRAEHRGLDMPAGDGLICSDPRLTLGVTVADCLPVFLYHSSGVPYGIVHSGWKGTGIAGIAVQLMASEYGAAPKEIHAVIGPGIGSCCYRVDAERADYFAREFGENTVVGGSRLDLRQANINVLEKAGIEHIAVCRDCTSCTGELGSYRREGPEKFTRMIALITFLL
jgi:polyphenol oxidase